MRSPGILDPHVHSALARRPHRLRFPIVPCWTMLVGNIPIRSFMAKRIMISVIGAGIGSLAGLLVSFLGGGNLALILGAVAGALVPLAVMGSPGR